MESNRIPFQVCGSIDACSSVKDAAEEFLDSSVFEGWPLSHAFTSGGDSLKSERCVGVHVGDVTTKRVLL